MGVCGEQAVADGFRKVSQRRQDRVFNQKAQQCMTLDSMSKNQGITRRDVFRDVLEQQRKNHKGCMTLPMTIAFFCLFAFAARLHEDITQVFFLESAIRREFEPGLEQLNTISDIWQWLRTDVTQALFLQNNTYGDLLPRDEWSRVLLYSQVQGSVVLMQSRDNSRPWGVQPEGLLNRYAESLNETNEGFISIADVDAPVDAAGRRMSYMPVTFVNVLPGKVNDDANYEFSLFPHMTVEEIVARLEYLQDRRWIDERTNQITLTALILNAELGRPRLEQLLILVSFSRGGAIYFRITLQSLFLEPFDGARSMAADALWIVLLMATTYEALSNMQTSFTRNAFCEHLSKPGTLLEWLIILVGWVNVVGFVMITGMTANIIDQLEVVQGWLNGPDRGVELAGVSDTEAKASSDLHKEVSNLLFYIGWWRSNLAFYLIVLMFRFFLAFRAQPRLAVVVNTLKATMVDILHFMVVCLPTFVAYVISGNILFGRRIEAFSTLQSSFGVCFRIIFETEYEWELMSEEHFWTAAVWVWSFLIIVVLLMLNMVLAIILDIYSEVLSNTDSNDTVFLFLRQIFSRLWNRKRWVRDAELDGILSQMHAQSTISEKDLKEVVPKMTKAQSHMLFDSCRNTMAWKAKGDLEKSTLLKLSASVKLSVDSINDDIHELNMEGAASGASGVTDVMTPRSESPEAQILGHKAESAKISTIATSRGGLKEAHPMDALGLAGRMRGTSRPFPGMTAIPGGYFPPLLAPEEALDSTQENPPEWYNDVRRSVDLLGQWMHAIQWQLQGMQWQWHNIHKRSLVVEGDRADNGKQDDNGRGLYTTL